MTFLIHQCRHFIRRTELSVQIFFGFTPDFEKLDYVFYSRPLFSKEGLIRDHLSLLPFADTSLKRVVKDLGGWEHITDPEYLPNSEEYERLAEVGFSKDDFNKTREYLSDRSAYNRRALARQKEKK